ncbi:extracellular solute-binding protein (plasmid) [Deinococcus sp. KNUC1210]|uniref:ABC transporter substrate-binding protein n=1 Tax=Deinococcus sp. KNUC1210 TaxID=2917691 RepID=UPI001EF116BC|nr:extracellular solute-binding protein [Deinococcus sp. KNUC1210]ULH18018.1 extracellular solute-binding protein [Deinococcus sp. KNUC1210]
MLKSTLTLTATLAFLSVATAQTVTLHVIGFKTGGELGALPALNAQFEQQNPGIHVEYEGISDAAGYDDVLRTRLTGGDAIDVFMGHANKDVRAYAPAGLALDLSREPWAGQLTSSARSLSTVNGKVAQLPLEFASIGLYYNKGMLDAVGAKVPQTYPEFLVAVAKLKAAGKTPMLVGSKDGWGTFVTTTAIAANTIYRKNPNYDDVLVAGKTKFDSRDWQDVLSRLTSLGKSGAFNVPLNMGINGLDQAMNEFIAGNVAFVVHGNWNVATIKKTNPDLRFGFQAFPGGPAGSKPIGIVLGGSTWMVNAKGKNLDAARKYLAFWAAPNNLKQWTSAATAFPTIKGVSSTLPAEMSGFSDAVSDDRAINFPFQNWPRTDFQDIYIKGLQNLLLGTAPRSVLQTWDKEFRAR